jgi:DNA-binding Lrp family transcriptional regulator
VRQSCWAITGEFDLMIVVRARSSAHLGDIIEQLRTIAPIRTRTTVVLNTFFEGRFPPLDGTDRVSGEPGPTDPRSADARS